jgi:hypothetical protein
VTPVERASFAAQAAALAVIAWGALAFGAVYPWAYWPLAAALTASAAFSLTVARWSGAPFSGRPVAWALAAVGCAIAAQLIPLPSAALAALSPGATTLITELNPAFAAGLLPRHPASVWPSSTWTALALYLALAAWLIGLMQLLSSSGSRRFVEALAGLGVVLALIGIVQKPLYSGAIYGLWALDIGRNPFGPFVNRNHFAGWMVMVLPLTLALLVEGISRSMPRVRPGWRHKVLWFSSPEASRLLLIAAAATVMALALVLTMSRSGMAAFVLSIVMTGGFVLRAFERGPRRLGATVCLVLLVAVVVAWAGPDAIATRFASADWGEFNNRRGAWTDAWSVVREFPITGTGLNTYWAAALFYQRHELTLYFAQAHNDYLQLAAEGGLLVSIPALICLGLFVRDVVRGMRIQPGSTAWWLRAGAVTSLVAIALQESVEFSLQMPGNAALFAVICAIGLHRPVPAEGRAREPVAPLEHDEPSRRLRLVSRIPARGTY